MVEEHTRLCRGSLSTSTAALLAMIEPDAARGKVLALSNGSFFREVLVEMTKILAARHGDAALDAVGIVHRLLWMRPDATLAERDSIASALVDIASGHRAVVRRRRSFERNGSFERNVSRTQPFGR